MYIICVDETTVVKSFRSVVAVPVLVSNEYCCSVVNCGFEDDSGDKVTVDSAILMVL